MHRQISTSTRLRRQRELQAHILANGGVDCHCEACEKLLTDLFPPRKQRLDEHNESSSSEELDATQQQIEEFQPCTGGEEHSNELEDYVASADEPLEGSLNVSTEEESERSEHEEAGPDPEPDPNPDQDPDPMSDDSSNSEASDNSSHSHTSDDYSSVPNYNIDNVALNAELVSLVPSTRRDALALFLVTTVRFHMPLKCLVSLMRGQNALLGYEALPPDKRRLWKTLEESTAGIKKHAYCAICLGSFGFLEDNSPNEFTCCGVTVSKKKIKYFAVLSLRDQLHRFLNTPGVSEKLKYRQSRRKVFHGNLEDIFDGEAYRDLQKPGGPLHGSNYNFSYLLNSDGFELTESGEEQAWPLFVRLNEVKPTLRQSCVFLVALWVDSKKPNFDIFLEFFVDEANSLSKVGVPWVCDGLSVTSKVVPGPLVVDGKARSAMLEMTDTGGYDGCTKCTHHGVSFGRGPVKFPTAPRPGQYYFDPPTMRTDQGMRADMLEAHQSGNRVNGHKGLTALCGLDYFDLSRNQVTDDLHPWFEGAARTHFMNFLQKQKPYTISDNDIITINRRIRVAKTPTALSRKPRDISKISKFTGTEMRNWLINLSIPCLQGKLPQIYLNHWSLLANASFLLHKRSISRADINEASRCIELYQTEYERIFGPHQMFFNIHMLQHSIKCCEDWGPQWTQSTMPFESWNFKLLKFFKSPKDPVKQMVRGYQMHSMANTFSLNENISPWMREEIQTIMHKPIHKQVETVGSAHFLGKSANERPTEEELGSLNDVGIPCDRLQRFERVLFNCIEFRSPQFNPDARSNNTFLHTNDDRFCLIKKIVIVHDRQNRHCGIFAKHLHVVRNLRNAPYIASFTESDALVFLALTDVQSLCVTIAVGEEHFISPIPNHFEID